MRCGDCSWLPHETKYSSAEIRHQFASSKVLKVEFVLILPGLCEMRAKANAFKFSKSGVPAIRYRDACSRTAMRFCLHSPGLPTKEATPGSAGLESLNPERVASSGSGVVSPV